MRFTSRSSRRVILSIAISSCVLASPSLVRAQWSDYGGDPQHSALSNVASQPLQTIHWQTSVDLNPQYSGDDLLIHYGSPEITLANTVVIPVKTDSSNDMRIDARSGADGSLKWSLTTDYIYGPHDWVPSYSPTITSTNRVYFPGAGGTVMYRDSADSNSGATGRLAFYGIGSYNANTSGFNNTLFINTPITSDSAGDIYFGYRTNGTTPLGAGFTSGIARIAADGSATFTNAANTTIGDTVNVIPTNCAPALSADGTKLYIATANSNTGAGDITELNASTLQPIASHKLIDPKSGSAAGISGDSTASPMVGPDGDVYYGVLEGTSNNHDRGYLLHFSSNLATLKTPGGFGWDDTPSVVPASMVPSYHGSSQYLIMAKYNNYVEGGGDGVNKVAILDPNATQTDPITGIADMKEVLTIAGQTPDPEFVGPTYPNAVREWCINTAAVDLQNKSILVNSEDGKLYRWDMTTNTFTQQITLTSGIGEAYTPTVIGPDGSVYAISNATLFNVGALPEPASLSMLALGALALIKRRRKPALQGRVGN